MTRRRRKRRSRRRRRGKNGRSACAVRGKKIKIIYYIILNRKNNLENFSCRPATVWRGQSIVCGGGGDVNFSQPGKVFTV